MLGILIGNLIANIGFLAFDPHNRIALGGAVHVGLCLVLTLIFNKNNN